jgi:hypothetical protein
MREILPEPADQFGLVIGTARDIYEMMNRTVQSELRPGP